MSDRRDELTLLRANLEDLHHEGDVVILLKPLRHRLLEHRGSKWAERLAPFDLLVEDRLHIGAPRISENRAIAERSRAPLHSALKPADDLPFGDCRCGAAA